jgi:chromosome segregation ATPase
MIAQLNARVQELEAQIAARDGSKSREVTELNSIIARLRAELEDHRSRYDVLVMEKRQQETYYADLIRNLEQQIADLKNVKANSEGNATHLEELVKKLERELAVIRQQLTIKEQETFEMTQKVQFISERIAIYETDIT